MTKDYTKDYAKLNEELMSKRLISKSDVINTNDSIPEKNKELIAKLQKELEIHNDDEKDLVPDLFEGPDGSKYLAKQKIAIKVPMVHKNVNQASKILPILDKGIEEDKDLEINKEIDNETGERSGAGLRAPRAERSAIEKDKEEELNMGVEGYSPYPTKDELLRDKLDQMRKDFDDKLRQREDTEHKELDKINKHYTELDQKCLQNGTCIEDDRRQTLDLFKQLQDRIALLERRKFVCRRCREGIISEGDEFCNVCGAEIVQYQPIEMTVRS